MESSGPKFAGRAAAAFVFLISEVWIHLIPYYWQFGLV